ncbi:hypothetical protein C493_06959 [Natronolimnohabitans innermongolicus JCM 12255]|uniref:Uncharacterized protein n=1 Tax=Natronolimnohabitans innermongolicus JCM 12255 TaxID=1227499 RepID=L9X995_9EURY|nr:hypothetical protein C493_06959 [Natronolimnohabitans innermongolicus JCM 12255]
MDLEVDTSEMLAPTIWLAPSEIRTGARLFLDVDHVGAATLTENIVDRTLLAESDIHVFGKCATGPWLVDRVSARFECSRWLWVITVTGEFVSTVTFLPTLPAAPVACTVFVALCKVDLVR